MTGWVAVVSTAYCLWGAMADGSFTRPGSVASNAYRLGTPIRVTASPTRQKFFVVRDRIGSGTQLDFWVPSCSLALRWGRRVVRFGVQHHETSVEALVRVGLANQRAAARAYRHRQQLS